MIRGLVGAESTRRIDELLERFGMADRADRPVQGFSTGQRKRLGLARALLHDPEVLFLDEPTSGLDPAATRDVVDLIGSLAAEHGRTVVLCTHFLGEAGRLADRMAVLDRGRLLAFGRPADLAAELWDGLDVRLDLGAPGRTPSVLDRARRRARRAARPRPSSDGASSGWSTATSSPGSSPCSSASGVDVYAAVPRPPTLEDVYFEIEARQGRPLVETERRGGPPVSADWTAVARRAWLKDLTRRPAVEGGRAPDARRARRC